MKFSITMSGLVEQPLSFKKQGDLGNSLVSLGVALFRHVAQGASRASPHHPLRALLSFLNLNGTWTFYLLIWDTDSQYHIKKLNQFNDVKIVKIQNFQVQWFADRKSRFFVLKFTIRKVLIYENNRKTMSGTDLSS